MKRTLLWFVPFVLLPLTGLAASNSDGAFDDEDGRPFLSFGSMYGVDGAFISNNVIRGVLGDELPWQIKSAHGKLTSDGHLRISVRGLVFPNDPAVPPDLRGINDEPTFRGLVSCLSDDGKGGIVTVNVATQGFAATRSGNSDIQARLALPAQCVAPIVFVLSGSEDKWFAVMGQEVAGP